MEKGLLEVVKGFAGFLKALGPQGMKASAQFFVFIMKVIEIALIGLGKYINDVATKAPRYVHNIANAFDWLRHHTATVFDGIRHDVAHYWDMTWNNTIGTVIRFGHNVETQFDSVKRFFQIWVARLEILFAGWAKNILHYAQDAFGWLPNFLPGVSALKRGLDTAQKDLASFVSNAQSTLHRLTAKPYALDFHVTLPPGVQGGPATGRRKYASGTTGAAAGWALVGERGPELVSMRGGETVIPNHALRGYASGTGGVVVHLSSPSVRELASVLGSYVSHIVRAIQSKYFAAIPAAPGVGGGVARWAPVALQALRMLGQPAGDLGVVLAQMQTESGGNPLVVNKWDSNWLAGTPSVGLMQVIGPTFGAYAGPFRGTGPFEYGTSVNPLANIYAGLNYAIHRYGAAWTRVLGQGHGYDHGGYLQPGWNLAYNGTGRPELVTPARGTMGAGGTTVYLTVQVGHGTHPVAAAQEIVKLLNVGARNGVRLRSSILGPG
jgi:SLT domain-containing protein